MVGEGRALDEFFGKRIGLVPCEIGVLLQIGDELRLAFGTVAEAKVTLFAETLLDRIVVGLRLVRRRLQRIEIADPGRSRLRRLRHVKGFDCCRCICHCNFLALKSRLAFLESIDVRYFWGHLRADARQSMSAVLP